MVCPAGASKDFAVADVIRHCWGQSAMKWAAEQRCGNSPMPYVFDVYGTLLDVDAAAVKLPAKPMDLPHLAGVCRSMAARQLSYTWLWTAMQRYTDFWP